jgi:pyrroloquinoline quinone biosynthesis protein D
MTDSARIPRLPRGVRLTQDSVRARHVLLAPERIIEIDDIAAEILALVDGKRSLSALVAELAARFEAPEAEIGADVSALLDDLAQKRMLVWQDPVAAPA